MSTPKAGDIIPVAYITKYALTEGIHEVHGWELVDIGGKFALRSTKPGMVPYSQTYIMPSGWTLDLVRCSGATEEENANAQSARLRGVDSPDCA